MAEENKMSRKHEMEMLKLMFGQPHPPLRKPSSSMSFHYNSPSSSGNSSRFQQILYHENTSLQKGKEAPRIRILSTICCNHHSLQHINPHGLPVKEIISSNCVLF